MQIFKRSIQGTRSLQGLSLAVISALATAASSPTLANEEKSAVRADDPLKVVVSLKDQRLKLYRGDQLIKSTRVSTGKRGHRTPPGVYSIIEKRRRHFSNLYNNAPMPYMQRITWSGLALHQGRVPRYPASHGCIRMPRKFARSLFGMTNIGSSVIVTRTEQAPKAVDHAKLFDHRKPALISQAPAVGPMPVALLGGVTISRAATASRVVNHAFAEIDAQRRSRARALDLAQDGLRDALYPDPKPQPVRVLILAKTDHKDIKAVQRMLAELGYDVGPVDGLFGRRSRRALRTFQQDMAMKRTGAVTPDVVEALYRVSGAPRPGGHLYIRQGFKDVFDMPVALRDPSAPIGTHLYTAMAFDPARKPGERVDVAWTALTVDDADNAAGADAVSALDRVVIPPAAREWIETMLQPNSTMIISDAGYGWETGKGTDFIVQPR